MINLKVNNTFLELPPNTTIQRERNSPFFLSRESGKDGIPSEASYPFGIPLTDPNMAALGYTDQLQCLKPKLYDAILMDEINQISGGKLQMRSTKLSLNQAGIGQQDANMLCNSSAFAQLIAGKKLKDLSLGGLRSFTWDGYNVTTGTGFWKHAHDTWNYANCDNGDYVFFPVHNPEYGGFSQGPNAVEWNAGASRIELADRENVTSLCPHIYLVYLIKQVFNEHGYTVSGDILSEAMMKKICLISMRGVYWSELNLINPLIGEDFYSPRPLSTIGIRLSEHVPQDIGIGEFLVELMKFLPLGFEIDDNSRSCFIKTLGQPTAPDRLKDVTHKVSPQVETNPSQNDGKEKIVGIRRNFNEDSLKGGVADLSNINFLPGEVQNWLPLPGPALSGKAFKLVFDNGYYAKEMIDEVYTTVRIGDNLHGYEPANATDYIESNMAPASTRNNTLALLNPPSGNTNYQLPHCFMEGNWNGKPTTKNFGLHVCFYHGKNYPISNNGARMAPYASSTNNRWVVGGSEQVPELNGAWSMGMELGGYGMLEVWWKEWLKVLAEKELLKARLILPLHEYLTLKWGDELLIENTSFVLKKINEVLPYNQTVDIEAVRWVK